MAEADGRIRRLRHAAALVSGPTEVIDFLLPLWAASDLGASPAAIGVVVAIEAAVSLLVRPLAGVLADRHDRRAVAAGGAVLYAVALVVYVVAPDVTLVGLGAAISGAGGSLFWVALRADAGAHLEHAPAVYARLLASEQAGSLVAFTVAFTLLSVIDYRPLFAVGAAACLLASVLLLVDHRRERPRAPAAGEPWALRRVGRRLAPLLGLTALTAGVEAGLILLLLLHLQATFDLAPQEIGLLFLPGAILLVVLPERAYALALRLGRARSMRLSLLATALFIGAMAVVDTPLVVAALWALCAAGLATAVPVEQTTVAQASAGHLGRGVGLYQTAALLGTLAAAPGLAAVYQGPGWEVSCGIAAGVLVLGAVLVPVALRPLGLPDALAAERTELP